MSTRRRATRALEHELPTHELAVVLADSPRGGRESGIGCEGTLRPFPHIPEHAASEPWDDRPGVIELVADQRVGGNGEILPFGFGWQTCACPAREGVRLKIADVRDGRRPVDFAATAEGELSPVFAPVKWCCDALALGW